MRGYFGIGIYHIKHEVNLGTLWRSACSFGASFIFTIGKRYSRQSSDTTKTWRHVPLYHYESIDDLFLPYSCRLVGIELGGESIREYKHPERCIYLLGAEDHGLPSEIMDKCHEVIEIPSVNEYCLNVASAGSIVMYDRLITRSK